MVSEVILAKAKEFFPDLEVKYKDESDFMKLLGKILFFNKAFMTDFTTTIGSTIYFPNRKKEQVRPISSLVVLLHEIVHIHDAKRLTKPLFSFLYLLPQILAVLCLPLLLLSWKFIFLTLLFAFPLPAYFRMVFERRAYLVSLYCMHKLSIKKNFSIDLNDSANGYVENFKDSGYYYMWPFPSINKNFADAVEKVKNGEKPYEDPVFDIIDKLLEVS